MEVDGADVGPLARGRLKRPGINNAVRRTRIERSQRVTRLWKWRYGHLKDSARDAGQRCPPPELLRRRRRIGKVDVVPGDPRLLRTAAPGAEHLQFRPQGEAPDANRLTA